MPTSVRAPRSRLSIVATSLVATGLSLVPLYAVACSSGGGDAASAPADASRADVTADAAERDARADAPSDAGLADAQEPPWDGQAIQPGCTENGCIRSMTKGQAFTKSVIALAAAPGQAPENGLTMYTVAYWSDGQEIKGSVLVPDSTPPDGGFGVVVMNQFTTGVAPSCAPSGGELAIGVGAAGAVHGFVTVVPDAPSYGPQPYSAYMVGKVAGRAALDGARAAFHTSSVVGVPVARKAVIAGLSEGAHSTMAAAAQMPGYAPGLEIRGFAAAEVPSHFATGMQASVQADDVPIPYDALRLWSWQGFLKLSGGPIFRPPYDTQAPGWFETECIYTGKGTAGLLGTQFPDASSPLLTDEYLTYARNDAWPADWAAQYAASEEVPVGVKVPIVIYEGTADTLVLPSTAAAYVAELAEAGTAVDYRVEDGGTHDTTALSALTVQQVAGGDAIAWIKQHLQ